LNGGEEAQVWRVESIDGPLVVHASPAWRGTEELAWIHGLLRFTARQAPEAVAPLPARDGSTLIPHQDWWLSLFPFVPGAFLDREDAVQREAAARLLARMHRAMLGWKAPGRRPNSTPAQLPPIPDPPELVDAALDAWRAGLAASVESLTRGPIHGDYYRRNVLWHDDRISGVIDWFESRIAYLIEEIAWSTWEFAKTAAGDDLHLDRAQDFLAAYLDEGGPVSPREFQHVVPAIRWGLRDEVRAALAAASRGLPWDPEYRAEEIRAFGRLPALTSHLKTQR